MVKTAIILADKKTIDLEIQPCLLSFSNENILTIMLNTLEKLNFTKIIVIIGYQSEEIKKNYKTKGNITWIHNIDYMVSESMHSLSLASQFITQDFLVLNGDLVIPSHIIQAITENTAPIVTAISDLTSANDEKFVEIETDFDLIDRSKNTKQQSAIYANTIGIAKISYALFNAMLDKYSTGNSSMHKYEEIMINLQNEYSIHCLHFDNTPWININDYKSYCKARDNIIFAVNLFNKNVRIVKEKITSIITEPIEYISLVGGMTNNNFKVTTLKNTYFVRLSGSGSDSLINRMYEPYNINLIQGLKINAPTLHIDGSNGLKITEYIPDSITLSKYTARLPQNLRKVASLLQTLHQSNVEFINEFNFIEVLGKYTKLLKNPIPYKNYQQVLNSIYYIKNRLLLDFEYCQAPCHNDLVPENLLLDKQNKLFLIDWEYSGTNDYYWDLASYLLESESSREDEYIFLSHYFNRSPSEQDLIKIKIYQAFQDILWAVWALVKKESNVTDFEIYGLERYERGAKTLRELFQYV